MIFSELALDLTGAQHPLYALRDEMLAQGKTVIDLVSANVSEHGMTFPQDLLQEIIHRAIEDAKIYRPDPFGQRLARESISGYYSALNIPPEQIMLTPGTSVSYWYCFKLLAEAGEEILCPLPSYPLLDYIAKICGVKLTNYRLRESHDWAIDFEDMAGRITDKTRAIVLISPHNPTGMVGSEAEIKTLVELAIQHGLAIISDEVFAEFLFGLDKLPRPAELNAPLVFTLNGLSKSFALPGLKLGWIAVSGEEALVQRALGALEMISDTFLPVSEITQFAVPSILKRGQAFRKDYIYQVSQARELAVQALSGVSLVAPKGGFYLTLSLHEDEDDFALRLLQNEQILAHPGHFYEMEGNHLVLTFIQDFSSLQNCLARLRPYIE